MSMDIGSILRQAREERSLTIEQVAQSTRIRTHYLLAMEAGEFNTLPSVAQARGFLRAYASFLSLNPDTFLAALDNNQVISTPESPALELINHTKATEGIVGSTLPEQTAEIFIEIGRNLQRQRELLGLSLDDVERHTHLRQHYLQALEAGDLERLPSPVQGRGMLSNYASFIGLNPDPLLLRFADGLQARLAARQAAQPAIKSSSQRRKPSIPQPLQRLLSADILIGGTLIVFLVVFVVWGAIRIFAMSTEQISTPTAPSIADVLLASPTPTDTPTPQSPTPTIPSPPQLVSTSLLSTQVITGALSVNPQGGVQVYVTVSQRAWMRVTVDGKTEFEGRVLPGSAYTFIGEFQVEILTGNGEALQIFYNGTNLGQMGNFGQVVNRIYNQQGVLNPTPTITPTPTATQPTTPTPIVTIASGPGEATAPPLP